MEADDTASVESQRAARSRLTRVEAAKLESLAEAEGPRKFEH